METNKQIRRRLVELFDSQNLAALSTHHEGQPYASLVAFYADDDLKHIYFVTPKTTRKYANLTADNRVAVMVNSSTNQASDYHQAISVTAVGKAKDVAGADKKTNINPISGQASSPGRFCAVADMCPGAGGVDSYFMVKHFQHVMELHLEP